MTTCSKLKNAVRIVSFRLFIFFDFFSEIHGLIELLNHGSGDDEVATVLAAPRQTRPNLNWEVIKTNSEASFGKYSLLTLKVKAKILEMIVLLVRRIVLTLNSFIGLCLTLDKCTCRRATFASS